MYDWTIIDRILDTYTKAGAKPFVEIGFMPKVLSTTPEPYQHNWPKTKISAGWAFPPKDYDKLYDTAARAVKRAAPQARVGGPATTSPSGKKAGEYLRQFLEFCDKTGAPLEFVTYHAKGRPTEVEGHAQMGLGMKPCRCVGGHEDPD